MSIRRAVIGVFLMCLVSTLFLGNTSPIQAQSSGLTVMLAAAPDSQSARDLLWYASLGDLERLMGLNLNTSSDLNGLSRAQLAEYQYELGRLVYYSTYTGLARTSEWQAVFGINSFTIDRELTSAQETDQFAVLDGSFDVGGINAALSAQGYQSVQADSETVLGIGGDNADPGGNVGKLAGARLNRVFPQQNRVIAASSTAAISDAIAASAGGRSLAQNPAYASVAAALGASLPNTNQGTLLSAALFSNDFINQRMSGSTAPTALPAYLAGGVGYQKSASGRVLAIALAYSDQGSAQAAAVALVDRLSVFSSSSQPDGFAGWNFQNSVTQSGNIALTIVYATMPEETDLAWIELFTRREAGFLKTP